MTKLNLKPAVRYQLDYMFWASLIAFAISIAVLILLTILGGVMVFDSYTHNEAVETVIVDGNHITIDEDTINVDVGPISFDIEITSGMGIHVSGLAGIFALMLFIIGIAGTREDLRFFLQHGMSRKTTYVSTLLTSIIIGVVYALVSELAYLAIINLPILANSNITFGFRASGAGFFNRWLSGTLLLFFVWQLGALISLIYYRMNTIAKIIFSIVAGTTILFGIPALAGYLAFTGRADIILNSAFFDFLSTPVGTVFIFVTLGAITTLGNFLLIRRAPIKKFSP